MWPLIIGYVPGMEDEGPRDDDEQIMTTTRHRDMIDENIHIVDIRDMKYDERSQGTTVPQDQPSIYFFKQHYGLHKKENVVYIALEYLPVLRRSSIRLETKWSSCLRRQYDNPYNK